jgi:hypothetical protein
MLGIAIVAPPNAYLSLAMTYLRILRLTSLLFILQFGSLRTIFMIVFELQHLESQVEKKPVIVSGSAFKLYVKNQLNNEWDGFEQRPEYAMFICATAYVIAAVSITITVVLR